MGKPKYYPFPIIISKLLTLQIKANSIQMNYELSGKKDVSVVMMSHSLGSSLVMWEPQMSYLEPHFRVLRYDICGHVGSEVTKGVHNLKLLGNDAIGLLDALSINKVHWVGLSMVSMSGIIGQCIALNHADRLFSLALYDTTAFVPEEAQAL